MYFTLSPCHNFAIRFFAIANFIIIAASSTIGQAIAADLLAKDHTVYRTARNGDKITPDMVLDATDFDAVDHAFAAAKAQMGNIDGVVNCAGSLLLKSAHMTSAEQYRAVMDASLTTSFAVARAAGKHMPQGGSVVLLSSAAALQGLANHDAIAAAKAGIIGLMLSCAATYAGNNLRFNAVAPGLTETALTAELTGNDMARKYSEAMHALGRLGRPEDIARAVTFLLDPENNWITGQVLAVDGGLSRVRAKMKI